MSTRETIVRVDATYDLRVEVGDAIHKGDRISDAPAQQAFAPVSGTVKSVEFDPRNHEFVIAILPTA
jgi:Na+-translocating ferredoxin:NAD+ oxidoreductase RnfC subunit